MHPLSRPLTGFASDRCRGIRPGLERRNRSPLEAPRRTSMRGRFEEYRHALADVGLPPERPKVQVTYGPDRLGAHGCQPAIACPQRQWRVGPCSVAYTPERPRVRRTGRNSAHPLFGPRRNLKALPPRGAEDKDRDWERNGATEPCTIPTSQGTASQSVNGGQGPEGSGESVVPIPGRLQSNQEPCAVGVLYQRASRDASLEQWRRGELFAEADVG